ncbi:E3 ubiquitin/ISG15 ligase TRIM25 [Channa argus]|uniref:E3 ubiquitin/ISG15 ligase TRIM25 n=1 Tax=Channa argus TaxID=215402 RepID=A0A6G1PCI0_CHAAH|nr:E3 ubiquitin/ISG15 ligase TRIM25 [Channa argus]
MAQANISVTESQFRCPICLDILKEPVSIPCGHTYCMVCINNYWDQADSGHSSCPQCRDKFSPRPVLRRNTVLTEVVDKLKLSEMVPAPELYVEGVGDVPCDFCTAESKLRAVKSCLVCLASLCELHVLPHREVSTLRRHKLVAAVERPAERLCAQHRLGLEPAGSGSDGEVAEWSGDCLLCEADQEEVHNVDPQRARRQVSASAVLEDSEALFADMTLRLEKSKAEVRARIEAKERAVVGRAERDVEMLEKDLEELRKRDEEIGQLLQTEDNAHVLQVLRSSQPAHGGLQGRQESAVPPPEPHRGGLQGGSGQDQSCSIVKVFEKYPKIIHIHCVEEVAEISARKTPNLIKPSQHCLNGHKLEPADQRMRGAFLRFFCRLSLDPNTAHPTLALLEGGQGAHCGEEPQSYHPHPQRFDSVAQVLCKEAQFGSASYWEVEWRGGGWIDIGVTYRSIGRKGGGKPCLLGRNENSWRLRCTHAGYAAWHDNRKTTVAAPPCPRIGVFLERQKGALSFYSVSDTVLLLHTFRCLFSQPLYPAFRLDLDSTLLICPHEVTNGNPT